MPEVGGADDALQACASRRSHKNWRWGHMPVAILSAAAWRSARHGRGFIATGPAGAKADSEALGSVRWWQPVIANGNHPSSSSRCSEAPRLLRSKLACSILAAQAAGAAVVLDRRLLSRRKRHYSGVQAVRMRASTARQSAVAEAEVKAEAKVESEPVDPELIEATVVADIEKELPPTNFLVIGNPGVGKSTLLNGLVASLFGGSDVYFESGVSFGSGLTYAFDEKKVGRHTFMDTPGLSDTLKRQQAADAITKALKCGGHYKVVFVVTLENGRVRADDLATMRLVLDAAPITNYGIIVNQVQRKILDRLLGRSSKKDEKRLQEILLHLLVSLEGKMTPAIHAVERDPDLEGEDNVVKAVSPDTLEFMCSLPGMEIEPQRVNPVMGEEFDKMRENLKSNMESVSKEVAKAGGMTMGLGTILAAVLEGEALAAACLTATVSGGTLLGLGVLGAMYAPYLAKVLVKEPGREEKEDEKDSEGVNGKDADVQDAEASQEAEDLEREVADFMASELKLDRSKVQEAMLLKDLGVEERALVKAVWDRFKVRIEESEAATRTLKDFVRDVVKALKGQMASILDKS